MTPSASSSTSPWVVWDRSGLTVEMRPGLLDSDRHSFLTLWGIRSQIDPLGDQISTCNSHDWTVDQVADLFRTTHRTKTQQVIRSRCQHCGDVEVAGYLANQAGPVPLVLDLRITHDRVGRSSDLSLNGNLRYPNDNDRSLSEAAADKILKYRADYNNNPPQAVAFMPAIASTSGRLHSEFIRLLFL